MLIILVAYIVGALVTYRISGWLFNAALWPLALSVGIAEAIYYQLFGWNE